MNHLTIQSLPAASSLQTGSVSTSDDDWRARRRPDMADDRALTGSTIDWFVSLPAPTKPESLCRQFPRVANMIAMMWPQRELTVVMVERLLTDDRSGTRAGFPADVTEDLKLLLQLRRGADNP